MTLPDYSHSIINLMASVAAALGAGATGYPALATLPPARLADRPVVLMVVDGLGAALLARHPDSHLARGRIDTLSSVFPTTTASALTSFATGSAPAQHAVTGWFTWLAELGSVAAMLPFTPRGSGHSYAAQGIEPGQLVGGEPLMGRARRICRVVTPAYIADSPYSRFGAGSAERIGYKGEAEFFARLADIIGDGTPGYTFAYWTELDSLGHEYGIASDRVASHFARFDAAFGEFAARIAGSGALVVVTADHGMIDTTPERTIRLEDHPALAETLAIPLCGEPRAAFCYVRPGHTAAFESYVSNRLAEAAELYPSEQLIQAGWFGRGNPDPRLARRIGDYALIMRDNWVIRDRLLGERPFHHIGVHGGISTDEMQVPLVVIEP